MSNRRECSRKHRGGSLRLPGYDYTQGGAYAVTVRAWGAAPLFGDVADGRMRHSAYGEIAQECCEEIPLHFPHAQVDTCVVMPNHLHVIFIVHERDQLRGRGKDETGERFGKPVAGSIPTIIRSLKSAVTRRINEMRGTPGEKVWQRGYYDHVIRDARELNRYRRYVQQNPLRWSLSQDD